MRLVLISDTHCLHDGVQLPEGDVLIHAGDFCGWGHAGELVQFCQWLERQEFSYKIVVAGNHDRIVQQQRAQAEFFMKQAGATYLEDSGVTICGMTFWGSPWTPEFLNWAFMKKRGSDIDERWRLVPSDVDILIAHGPPLGILDAMENGNHIGCEMMAQRLKNGLKPKLFVCGHNHAGYGRIDNAGTAFINVAIANEAKPGQPYQVVNQPVVLDLRSVKVA